MKTDSLLVASNRGPVSWRLDPHDVPIPRRGFGGLVTALGGALQDEPGTWVSVAMSDVDREVAAQHPASPFAVEADGHSYRVRVLDPGDRFEAYYNEVSNRLLWFTMHGLWNPAYEPTARGWPLSWEGGYKQVNADIAAAIAEAAGERPEVHLHDYHLAGVAGSLRERLPDTPILHYLHTPWPRPRELGLLPDTIAQGVMEGLLAADVIGLSAPEWASAFRRCAVELCGASVDGEAVLHKGRRTVVSDFVLGVDELDLSSSSMASPTLEAGRDLDTRIANRQLLLRVDRTDLSKNILRGLLAYELLLERHPEHRGKVWHYAHLNPSRQGVEEYRAYLSACHEVADRIRSRFGEDSLEIFVGDDYPRAVAALQRYDVLLVNPVRDGTNLVAKEGPVLNERDGVLVLSRETGAATVLRGGAVVINPFDIEEQADALHLALVMGPDDRAGRARELEGAARVGPPETWFAEQRKMLHQVVGWE